MFLNAPGSIAFSQEHFKTISYAKFGGQTECIMGNWKIVNETLSVSLCREIVNVFGEVRTCFDHVLSKFSGFSWERILFLKYACVNMVMQIQVQIGDTRRLFFFMNPHGSVEDLKKLHFAWYSEDKNNFRPSVAILTQNME